MYSEFFGGKSDIYLVLRENKTSSKTKKNDMQRLHIPSAANLNESHGNSGRLARSPSSKHSSGLITRARTGSGWCFFLWLSTLASPSSKLVHAEKGMIFIFPCGNCIYTNWVDLPCYFFYGPFTWVTADERGDTLSLIEWVQAPSLLFSRLRVVTSPESGLILAFISLPNVEHLRDVHFLQGAPTRYFKIEHGSSLFDQLPSPIVFLQATLW